MVNDRPARCSDPVQDAACTTTSPASTATLLFAVGLATVLPLGATQPPERDVLPTIRSDTDGILDSVDVAAMLNGAGAEVGRGRVALVEMDWRLRGLVVSFQIFRVTGGAGLGALITLGSVGLDRATSGTRGATPADLWTLARETIPLYGGLRGCHLDGAADAILVHYGTTSQVAWLAADHLATVSVTDLGGNEARQSGLAQAIARLVAPRLASRVAGR
ncbi:MAG: hypothetical protein IT306_09645 [Chloroflexi bacterium]|nr:hypothetical protein [Chloroflexota bacterium]